MIHAFLIKLGNEQRIEGDQEHQDAGRELSAHPMFQELEEAIGVMERHIAETSFKYKLLLQLRRDILESFGIKEKPEPETKAPERKKEMPKVKAPPLETDNLCLTILEDGIKKVIKILKKAPMLKRFKSLKRTQRALIAAIEKADGQTETDRIVQMEAAIGETLSYLQTAKMAIRSSILKSIKKILEETIDNKNQTVK